VETESAWQVFSDAARREAECARQRSPRLLPHYSENGEWILLDIEQRSAWEGDEYEHGNWTAGFWYGQMWLVALATMECGYADLSRQRIPLLASRATDLTTHDLGFLFSPSYVLGLEMRFLSPDYVDTAIQAARTLIARFNDRGSYLQAFGPIGHPRWSGTTTVDTMMNLPLLWWASQMTGDSCFADLGKLHARTWSKRFVRDDGAVYHLAILDPQTGSILRTGTFQGATDKSCWSRGQAWAVAGFACSYAATGEEELLATALRTADYYLEHVPETAIPLWDFHETGQGPEDASASAIAALGCLILGKTAPDPHRAIHYWAQGEALLRRLADIALNRDGSVAGILQRSSYSVPHGKGLRGATAWGDFYFGLGLGLATGRVCWDTVCRALGLTRVGSSAGAGSL
jgi:unsaturated chondroitin disaccharide hydrolase